MTLLTPHTAYNHHAPLARRSPVAKLGAALLPALALLASVDPVAPAIVLLAALGCVPGLGLTWSSVARRLRPIAMAVAAIGVGNAVFTDQNAGTIVLEAGPVLLTTQSLAVGATAALRVGAIALPGVLAVMTIDPVDLADSLVAHLKVPERFAYGSLAALRLVPLLVAEWQVLGQARRARGLGSSGNPLAAVRMFLGKVFALLVAAIRRGTRVATAMQARGFAAALEPGRGRTCARQPSFRRPDAAVLVASALLTTAAVTAAVLTGVWNPVLS